MKRTPDEVAALAERYVKAAYWMANKYGRLWPSLRKLGLNECVSIACVALLRAAREWDGHSCPFGNYACHGIYMAFQNVLRRPQKAGPRDLLSLEEAVVFGNDASSSRKNYFMELADRRGGSSVFDDVAAKDEAQKLLSLLPAADRPFVELYVMGGLTLEEASKKLGVSRERVRQRVERSLDRLRNLTCPQKNSAVPANSASASGR